MKESLKRSVWIASNSVTGGVRQYAAPVEYKWNWRTLTSGIDMMAFGPEHMNYRRASMTNAQLAASTVAPFDRVWMDVTPPTTHDPLAKTADFYVVAVNVGAGGIGEVLFKRLSADA